MARASKTRSENYPCTLLTNLGGESVVSEFVDHSDQGVQVREFVHIITVKTYDIFLISKCSDNMHKRSLNSLSESNHEWYNI